VYIHTHPLGFLIKQIFKNNNSILQKEKVYPVLTLAVCVMHSQIFNKMNI
jgi:hypothetical protein